jgi:hypothetical protein
VGGEIVGLFIPNLSNTMETQKDLISKEKTV